jgi:hypothetical protein
MKETDPEGATLKKPVPRPRVVEASRELPASTSHAVNRTACKILARLEPGTVWTPAEKPAELERAA